jgi:hypothetical protein
MKASLFNTEPSDPEAYFPLFGTEEQRNPIPAKTYFFRMENSNIKAVRRASSKGTDFADLEN